MNKSERVEFIDYAKAIGIILVIIGHINAYNSFCKLWLYAFHMPLFFILSGILLKPKEISFKSLIANRCKRLLVPYLIWGLMFASFSLKNILFICYGTHKSLLMAGSLTSLWFFPVLLVSSTCGQVIVSKIGDRKWSNMLCLLFGGASLLVGVLLPHTKYGYPFGIDISFVSLGLIMIGKISFNLLMKLRSLSNIWLAILTFALAVITIGAYFNVPDYGYVSMAENIYGNPIVFLVVALAGSLMVICLSILLERIRENYFCTWLLFIGRNSLTIMLLHKPIISISEKICIHTPLPNIVCLLSITVATLLVCWAGIKILNAFVPQIVGNYGK